MGRGLQLNATADGQPVKIVSIIDEHTRECLGRLVDHLITADLLSDELDRLATRCGYPAVLRCDTRSRVGLRHDADRQIPQR